MAKRNVLGFGKDNSSVVQPVGITGEENNKLITISMDDVILFQKILKELKKFNMNLSIMTGNYVSKIEVENYKSKL
ncbi:hypothetical protein LCGC14_2174640 [marine sediment metagenome]|uniref:Uncharacterized protein n=1 Tax=marine sediment metagenome TaxID=412755 RepID=A0A0F9G1R2_9ZZZZ